ncbi:MAG: aminotransferase class III-fold pyridoxal phosphate-dependent enzyme [Deltaproteobacteria bacterium]|nr:aminotransferase class III-fold pyridoxal phosphate-dependent enzyme [Deltaproteobacteria bacterium]
MAGDSTIDRYIARFPRSRQLFERAKKALPRGVSHDGWFLSPFPIYIKRAKGSREWDIDGFEYVDYIGGHGALLLGHAHRSLVEALEEQARQGTHFGASHELQVQWAEQIKVLVPSAEKVEFTNSGTEANMLALRLARTFTGRKKILKFRGHFGGFADHLMVGTNPPWEMPGSAGILPCDIENTLVIPANDEKVLERALAGRDVALLMVEAAGAFSGVTGIAPSFYRTIRDLTSLYGTLLHFDEVVTGFRYAPGGVQGAKGIMPDITSLGKVLTGGVPGAGALVGRADIMDLMQFKDNDMGWNRFKRVSHTGTFNGNPLCASAGITTLGIIADGSPQRMANDTALTLRHRMQEIIDDMGLPGCAYGDFSVFHLYFGECAMRDRCDKLICLNEEKERSPAVGRLLAMAMALHGVHIANRGYDGFISAAHDEEDVSVTLNAFKLSVYTLVKEGLLGKRSAGGI